MLKLCIFDEKDGLYVHHFVDAKSHSIGNDMKLCDSNGYDTTNEKHSHGNYFDKEESRS